MYISVNKKKKKNRKKIEFVIKLIFCIDAFFIIKYLIIHRGCFLNSY